MEKLDLIIVGAGPTGLSCGIEAKKAGLDFLILEKGVLVNSLFHFPTNMTFFSTSKLLEIGEVPFISHNEKPTRREALEYYRRIKETWKLPVKTFTPVENIKKVEGGYKVITPKQAYFTRTIIVSSGFYDVPRLMEVPGEALPKVKHYYDEAHPYIGQKVLVVGAANSACDVALELWQKGAAVTMAIREGEIYPRVKYWIKPNIENRIKEGSIPAYFHTTVKEILPDAVILQTPEGEKTIENDVVMAMTGYQPNYKMLKQFGIEIPDDETRIPVYNNDTFETNLPGVYLAGVVCAGMNTSKLFIENTRDHGAIIVKDILQKIGKEEE
ncbi:MAG: YpdA family putative bacillithiol disulfide reductase [Saprospiraceae bacterium]|nr:YpdA family putative bacillithiol disulfide reductase [Saprospiraceae bacterium]